MHIEKGIYIYKQMHDTHIWAFKYFSRENDVEKKEDRLRSFQVPYQQQPFPFSSFDNVMYYAYNILSVTKQSQQGKRKEERQGK